jgi:hypothetical protein
MNRQTSIIALAAAMGVAAVASVAEGAPKADAAQRSCFSLRQLEGTRADGDKTIYARVGLHDIYRLDLAFRCTSLANQNGIILTPAGGRDNICGPLDLDLRARGIGGGGIGGGGSEPCAIKSITRLTPEEAAALPRKVRP